MDYPVNYHLFQANPYLIIYLIVKKLGFLYSSKLIKQNSDAKSNGGMVNVKGIRFQCDNIWSGSALHMSQGGDHSKFGLATKLCSPQTEAANGTRMMRVEGLDLVNHIIIYIYGHPPMIYPDALYIFFIWELPCIYIIIYIMYSHSIIGLTRKQDGRHV